jgi:two-component system chemotaxis sensor kinase CheA
MVRNAIDHGIEPPAQRAQRGKPACGRVTLRAGQSESCIVIEVEDDGAGLDRGRIAARLRQAGRAADPADPAALLDAVFEPGFSTAESVTDLSGRGVGLDVVRGAVEALHGSVAVRSRPGQGAVFTLRLPLTLANIAGFAVRAGDETFILPMDAVVECLDPGRAGEDEDLLLLRDSALPVLDLGQALRARGSRSPRRQVVVVRTRGGCLGLKVDDIAGECQAVVKPLGGALGALPSLLGATILGDGRVALIVDPSALRSLIAERRTS